MGPLLSLSIAVALLLCGVTPLLARDSPLPSPGSAHSLIPQHSHSDSSPADSMVGKNDSSRGFCRVGKGGTGFVMGSWFMASWADSPDAWCSLLWFEGWTLDTPVKYSCAVLGVFVLALASEALVRYRREFERRQFLESSRKVYAGARLRLFVCA